MALKSAKVTVVGKRLGLQRKEGTEEVFYY